MGQVMNRAGCLPKGVAHGERIGQELLLLAKRARAEGKLSEEDWQSLPSTPEEMFNLFLSRNAEQRLIDTLLNAYA